MHQQLLKGQATRNQAGFTLVELMITVVVIAILAMVAIPAYNDSVKKGRRSDAKSMLTTIAARQEQYFMDNKTYASNVEKLGYSMNGSNETASTDGHYMVRISSASTTDFEAEAQPVAEDDECQQMTITADGTKGVEAGTNPATAAPDQDADYCW